MSSVEVPERGLKAGLNTGSSAQVAKRLIAIFLLIGLGVSGQASAQDLEPRRWSHLPIGLNVVGIGYTYTDANIYFNPFWNITNGTAQINTLGLGVIHNFDLAGKSARFSLLLPYSSGRWDGDVDGEFRQIERHGVGDPRLRFSVNLYGAPALKGAEFERYQADHTTNTVVGASLAMTVPLGKYCDDCLINIGNNRWSARPQIGVVHTRGPWSFELTASAFLFTDNNNFLREVVLKQETLYAAQTHAVYSFKSGLWFSLSTGYGSGGRIFIDKQKTQFEVDNWLWAAGFGFPMGQTQSLHLTWISGRTQNDVGRDSDNLLLRWSARWAN